MKRHFWILTAVIMTGGCATKIPPPDDFQPPKKVLAENHPFKWNVNEGLLGVRFGMHPDQVTRLLGKPSELYGHPGQKYAWQYHSLGLLINFNELDRVVSFTASDGGGDPDGWLKPFRGVTDKGIQMGSTQDEIIQAYGAPSVIKTYSDGTRQVLYSSPEYRLVFMLKKGRVYRLTAVKKPVSGDEI
jgi:hypothetical protein